MMSSMGGLNAADFGGAPAGVISVYVFVMGFLYSYT